MSRDPGLTARRLLWALELGMRAPLEARFPYRSPEAIARARDRAVRRAVEHACRHVPHYRELGIEPGEIRGLADLHRLGIAERRVLHDDPERFASDLHRPEDLIEARTGGSMGMPVVVRQDLRSTFLGARLSLRRVSVIKHFVGRRFHYRGLNITNPDAGGKARREAFGAGPLVRRFRPSRVFVSMHDPLDVNLDALERERPDVLSGFGSYLEELLLYAREARPGFHHPRLVSFGGDAMSERGRELVEGELGIPVRSAYGSIEAPVIGFECEQRSMHLNCDAFPVRIVDPAGVDVAEGEVGDVVVSNLLSRGTTLLNYRIGDRAALLGGRCGCGRNLPRLGRIEGRVSEWIEGPAGEALHGETVRTLFRAMPGVISFHVRQRARTEFDVAVIGEGVVAPELERTLAAAFSERLGVPIAIRLELLSSLPRSASGKVIPLVSDLNPLGLGAAGASRKIGS